MRLFRLSMLLTVLAGMVVFSSAVPAQQPSATPAAPAATPALRKPLPEWLEYRGLENQVAKDSLDRPHMDATAVKHWTSSKVAEAMSFRGDKVAEHRDSAKALFNEYGWDDFNTYLKRSGLENTVVQKKYAVSGIVDAEPGIFSEGILDGTYHWYLELPLMISFYPIGKDGNIVTEPAATGQFIAQVQIGRYELDVENGGMKMESWNVIQR